MKKDVVTDKSFKYEVSKLDNTSDEFKFIEDFVHTTIPKKSKRSRFPLFTKYTKLAKTARLKPRKAAT